jgi:hypothetical protein
MKKVLVQFTFPNMSSKVYEQAWEEVRKSGNENPKGLLYHAGAQQGNNWVVADVWESAEAFTKFGEVLGPIMEKLGFSKVQPTVLPVHYLYVNEEAAIH